MSRDEINSHWDHIQRMAKEYDAWPEWKRNAVTFNYRAEEDNK